MVTEHEAEHPSRWAAVSSIAAKIGCSAHRLNEWVKKGDVDGGKRAGLPSDVAEKMCVSASNIGSDAISMTSRHSDDACLKQIKFPAAVHLTLDELELCDLAVRPL